MRSRVVALIVAGLSSAASAVAQPPPPPRPPERVAVPLKGFGEAQVSASRVQLQAGQLEMDVHALRDASKALPLPAGPRTQVTQAADNAIQVAQQFRILAGRGAPPAEVLAVHASLDQAIAQFAATVQPYAAADPAIAQTLRRVQLSDERLHGLLAAPEPNAEARRRRVVRLATAIEDNVGELRAAVNDALPQGGNRGVVWQLRQVSVGSRQLAQLAARGDAADRVPAEAAQVVAAWQAATPTVTQLAGQNARVRLEAAQVDRLVGELARAAGGPAAPPPAFGVVAPSSKVFVVGAGEGGGPRVRVLHELNGPSTDFFAYDPSYRGGVRVATADLNGDGYPDIVTAPGRDTQPLVRVFDGRTLALLTQFVAYDPPYDLGTFVAAADLTKDGKALIAVGTGDGGLPHVKLFDIAAGKLVNETFPYGKQARCGVRVALADIDGDGVPDFVTAPGPSPGVGPRVSVFYGRDWGLLKEFDAFDSGWRGGLHVALANVRGDAKAELIVGTDAGGAASVRIYDPLAGRLLADWRPYGDRYLGGVRVGAFDVNGDGTPDVVTAPGVNSPGVPVRAYDGRTRRLLGEFVPFEGGFAGGAFISGR